MQILRPHPRPTESETLGWVKVPSAVCGLKYPQADSDGHSDLRTTELTDGFRRHGWKTLATNAHKSVTNYSACKILQPFQSVAIAEMLRTLRVVGNEAKRSVNRS